MLSVETKNPNVINKTKRPTDNIFLNWTLNKKSTKNPNKKNNNGILFPESNIPTPEIHIIIMVNIILGVEEYNEAADLSGDSIVNVLDVIQLMNLILGD